MGFVPHTAMVLAAGLGQRMRPLTETRPKPLIEVAGKTLIDRALDPLAAAGVRRVVVNVHWLADQVEAHFAGDMRFEIVISDERDGALETGGALAKARPLLGEDPVFVINTDAFWAPEDAAPYQALAAAFDSERMDALLLLADRKRCLGFGGPGDFFRDAAGALDRRGDAPSAPWAYAGVRIIKPQLYDNAPVEPFSALKTWAPLIEARRLHGHLLDRFWLHVGDPDALKDAEMWLRCHGA
ncbi:MAG: nucleotidyltransferase family protein [Pseudomonadota bacterium]